uniref:Cytoplasmic protein n=2 Tax=Gloeothece TaxID=28070 RepID=E0U6W4_GLOV7|nr:conserved hypothetical protein [Gloeothece verrucosa PCC 7822]
MFDYSLDFDKIDFRQSPELYRIGRGEQGVLLVEPYKSEILPHWRFKTPEIAKQSSEIIYNMFLDYLNQDDFVGADMARKFLQMGYTRARRYANHKSGRKYKDKTQKTDSNPPQKPEKREILPYDVDPIKAQSAAIFKEKWCQAKLQPKYLELKKKHQQMYEQNSNNKNLI